jgi:hypothetical protein
MEGGRLRLVVLEQNTGWRHRAHDIQVIYLEKLDQGRCQSVNYLAIYIYLPDESITTPTAVPAAPFT